MPATSSINASYFILAAVIVGGIIISFIAISPALDEISQTREAIEGRSAELASRETFLQTLDRKAQELRLQSQYEQQLNVILPVEERFEDALRIVSQSADQSGIVISQISNTSDAVRGQVRSGRARGEQATVPQGADVLGVSIDFRGTYQQLRAFLKVLERSPRLMDVTRFEIISATDAPDQLDGTMSIMFYQYDSEGEL